MTYDEMNNILMVETFEKEDLMNPNLADQYIIQAERQDYSATMIADPKYAEMARSMAAWNRKVAEAIKLIQNLR